MFLILLLFASIITGCVVAVKSVIKEHCFNVINITAILNVVLFIIIFFVS